MNLSRGFSLALFACLLALPSFAQQAGVVVLNTSSKELKRTAHRLRIPAEQLKNARQTLQEATDLAKKVEPCPTEMFFSLAQAWVQLDRSKSKAVLESLIQDLRSDAANCPDFSCYQRVTAAAMGLMQSSADMDYEKVVQLMRNWPEPKESAGEMAKTFKSSMDSQVKRQALLRLANSDPEKALEMLPQMSDSTGYGYSASAQIAQGLMNAGKKEEALRLIDQTAGSFDPNAADARTLQDYENFVRTAINLDSARASTAVDGLINALVNQNFSGPCGTVTLKTSDATVDLTCAESRALNFVRSFPMKPGFTLKTLGSVPGLKAKLDRIGGIDALYGGSGVNISYNSMTGPTPAGVAVASAGISAGASSGPNIPKLIQEIKGKDPAYIKSKLKEYRIDVLVSLAMSAAYQDPDLGATALEMAQQLLPQVEPVQKRASTLQTIVQAYRQVEGEVDQALLKSGFILADELKQELSEKNEALGKPSPSVQMTATPATQLEAFLVAELSRSSYDSAIRYVHSMESNVLKLTCLLQIVQALSQPNF